MRTLDRSDLWFGAVVVAMFALGAVVLFGGTVTDSGFWFFLLPFVGFFITASMMRRPLSRLDRAPRFVAWFSIGVTAAVFIALGGGYDFSAATAAGFGAVLAVIEVVGERFAPKEGATNGRP